jgi:hypothetical protein
MALGKPLDAAYKGRLAFKGMQRGYPGHGSVTSFRFETAADLAKASVRHWTAEAVA